MLVHIDVFNFEPGEFALVGASLGGIGNAVRELSRFMTGAGLAQLKAMYRVMIYCLNTAERGKVFKSRRFFRTSSLKGCIFKLANI